MNKQALLEAGLQANITDMEIFERQSKTSTLKIFEQSVDSFQLSQCNSIRIRGIYQNKMGSCIVEEDSDDVIPAIISLIKQNAVAITSDDKVEIYAGDKQYPIVEYSKNSCLTSSVEEKVFFLKKLEIMLKESDPRILQVMGITYQDIESAVIIDNSKNVHIAHKEAYSILMGSLLVKDGDDQKSAYEVISLKNLDDFKMEEFVESLCHKAVSQLHGEPVVSKQYPILMEKNAMAALLENLTGLFNGENAHKGISLLKEKQGQQIFDKKITVIDNPLLKDGFNSSPFDDEGVACFEKVLVDQGTLRMYMHNLKSANLMKCTSTGNGFGSIEPSNLYIKAGDTSYEKLIEKMDTGIIITELNGLHAGLNALTTEFSLQASGYYVENKKIVKAVNLITVAGNFLELMKTITAVGNDVKFQLSGIGAPSILFPSMAVSGK